MENTEIQKLRSLTSFEKLVDYLRDELDWPIEAEDADALTFEYTPEELGLGPEAAVKVREIRQLRPFIDNQLWGIFWIDFEPKRLPITIMRRILSQLVTRKRGASVDRPSWQLDDLLLISAVGEEKTLQRELSFAHFHQEHGDLPTLRVLGWDGADTPLKLDYVARVLHEKLRWPANPKDAAGWRAQWASAFRHKPGHIIRTADALAARLAILARSIRAAAQTIMAYESEDGRLRKLHKAFQTALIHDLSEADFADTYAQTITYGLLTAAISRTDLSAAEAGTALVAENITDMVPVTNPFLKEMLGTFLHAGGRKGNGRSGIDFDELGIQDVVELLRSDETDLPAILRDFNNRAEGEDPVIRFYEDFLEAYDKELKVQRGVFYTPKPVVSYIVRGVHELLQSEFGLEDGLAATATWGEMVARNAEVKIPTGVAANSFFVMILDPATGTATFLVEVIDVIYKTMVARWKKQGYKGAQIQAAQIQAAWNEYVPTSLLPRLYGYELMMAPYAIAHMKIGLKLFETGYRFRSDQRANVYLTNALEEPSQLAQGSAASLFEALGHESQAVNDVKRGVHFTVVIGNPPYAKLSSNRTIYAESLVESYKRMVAGERNVQPLSDDYIKFMAYSIQTTSRSPIAIISMITNRSYLNGLIHPGLRSTLIDSFSKITILDCHGDNNVGEDVPVGYENENLFDIRQGVSIFNFVKMLRKEVEISTGEIWGTREEKYDLLNRNSLQSLTSKIERPLSPNFFFKAPSRNDEEYTSLPSLIEIFGTGQVKADQGKRYGNGIKSNRDALLIDIDKNNLKRRIASLADFSITDDEIRKRYELEDSPYWNTKRERKKINIKLADKHLQPITYRPFDERWIWYQVDLIQIGRGGASPNLFKHVLNKKNITLLASRNSQNTDFSSVFCTRHLSEMKTADSTRASYCFPLYAYSSSDELSLFPFSEANFSAEFMRKLRDTLGLHSEKEIADVLSPEDVFHYMYAVFHSPTYRSRYAEFLKMDFPRLPLTSNVALFRQLCGLGAALVGLHLLEDETLKVSTARRGAGLQVRFASKGIDSQGKPLGSVTVAKGYPKYDDGNVYINAEAHFAGIPAEVWEFHIGGYQVCEKWLKDRRERELSAEDILHYGKVASALGETIRIMGEVDAVIESHGGWPVR
jgi:hypothetical protein